MNNTNTITKITNLLNKLEESFYEIDSGIIQHPELCSFAFNMELIIKNIKQSLLQNEINNIDVIKKDIQIQTDNNKEDLIYEEYKQIKTELFQMKQIISNLKYKCINYKKIIKQLNNKGKQHTHFIKRLVCLLRWIYFAYSLLFDDALKAARFFQYGRLKML